MTKTNLQVSLSNAGPHMLPVIRKYFSSLWEKPCFEWGEKGGIIDFFAYPDESRSKDRASIFHLAIYTGKRIVISYPDSSKNESIASGLTQELYQVRSPTRQKAEATKEK